MAGRSVALENSNGAGLHAVGDKMRRSCSSLYTVDLPRPENASGRVESLDTCHNSGEDWSPGYIGSRTR